MKRFLIFIIILSYTAGVAIGYLLAGILWGVI